MIMRFNDLIISRKLQLSGNEMQLRRSSWRIRLCVTPIKNVSAPNRLSFTPACHFCRIFRSNRGCHLIRTIVYWFRDWPE